MALFGDGGRTRREPRSVVEFRAGKMTLSGTTLSPDVRKGLVYMKLEDNLMHFCWKERSSGQLEDDFIIFPGDAKILRVSQCTTGRVVLLKFKDNGRKYFYWLQEPKEDKDEEYIKKVNEFIDNPTSAVSALSDTGLGELGNQRIPQSYMANLLQGGLPDNATQQQLLELLAMSSGNRQMEILHGRGPGMGHVLPAERSQQRPQLQLGDLQTALESLQVPQQSTGASNGDGGGEQGGGGGGGGGGEENDVQLRDILSSEALRPIVRDSQVSSDLAPHLPPTNEPTEAVVTSPQFQQAMSVFSSALSSGQLGPLVTEFGLSSNVSTAAATGNMQTFAEAMENELKEENKEDDKEGGEGGGGGGGKGEDSGDTNK